MSGQKTVIGDKMIIEQLKENSQKLDISVDELIERYVRRGLYKDLYYKNNPLCKRRLSEVIEIGPKE